MRQTGRSISAAAATAAALMAALVAVVGLLAAAPEAWAQQPAAPAAQPATAPAGQQRAWLGVTADVGVTSVRDKTLFSNGAGPTTPIHQNQNWSGFEDKDLLMAFDTRPIKGWSVKQAWLHLYVARGNLYGVGVCTFLAPWQEGSALNGAPTPGCPSWDWAQNPGVLPAGWRQGEKRFDAREWAWHGSKLHDVCWSHPAARFSHAGPDQIERFGIGVPPQEGPPPTTMRGQPATLPAMGAGARALGPAFLHLRIPVDPALVESLAAGVAHGLILTDDKGQVAESYSLLGPGYPYATNDAEDAYVFTRDIQEPSLRPRLEVLGDKADTTPPAAPKDLKVVSTSSDGTVVIEFTAPGDDGTEGKVLAYEATLQTGRKNRDQGLPDIDKAQLPRWTMPRPVAGGQKQRMPLFDVAPVDKVVEGHWVMVRAVDEAGNRGPAAELQFKFERPEAKLAAAPKPTFGGRTPALDIGGGLTLAAYPDTVKIDPVTAAVMGDGQEYKLGDYASPIWDGKSVRLQAAVNEVLGFQLVLGSGQPVANVSLSMDDLAGPANKTIAKVNAEFFRLWYVKAAKEKAAAVGVAAATGLAAGAATGAPSDYYGDACLPLAAPFPATLSIPPTDNAVPGQRYQAVWVDLYVPRGTAPGKYAGTIRISPATSPVPVEVEVLPLALPDEPSWIVEINRYNSVLGWAGVDMKDPAAAARAVQDYYRLAHRHRAVLNVLPYTHSSRMDAEYLPDLAGKGTEARAANWDRFDRFLGPLLDGSAFSAEKGYVGPGAGVPINHMYLPFHEGWPMPVNAETYKDYADVKDRLEFAEYAAKARRVEQSFTDAYKQGYIEVAKQFFEHAAAKGYTRTSFQFFGNDKYYWKAAYFGGMGRGGTSFWLFDEPSDFDDYEANALILSLGRRGLRASGLEGKLRAAYRVDVSQPEMTRTLWDDVCSLWVVGGLSRFATTAYHRGYWLPEERHWSYGGGPGVVAAPVATLQHLLNTWAMGGDGNMPHWDAFRGSGGAWKTADDMAVYYSGRNYAGGKVSVPQPIPGLRLKLLRRSQQDLEYLYLLSRAKGWDRPAVRAALSEYADDPSQPLWTFGKLDSAARAQMLERVKRTLLK